MYSDISIRIIASSSSNIDSAKVRANSVFPTPVGPKKIKEPIGRFGSFSPALARRMALDTAFTASDCPMTRLCNTSSMFNKRSLSCSVIFTTGTPVQVDTTAAIPSSPTEKFIFPCFFSFYVPLVLQPVPLSKLTQLQQYLLLLLNDFLCLVFLSIWFRLLLIFLSSSVLYRGKKQLFQILDLALRNLFLFSPVLTQIPVP